jgi:hypothetical protein
MRFPVSLRLVFGACFLMGLLVVPTGAFGAPSEHRFEIVPGSFSFTTSTDRAGAHADWTTAFEFAPAGGGATYGDAREVIVKVPAGFDASDTAVPMCTQAQLLALNKESATGELPDCPLDTQLGDLAVEIALPDGRERQETVPVYNMEVTSFGVAAELGYKTTAFTGLVQVKVRPEDLGLTARTLDIPPAGEVHKIVFTVWGVPAATEHDAMRGARCGVQNEIPPICHNEFGEPQKAGVIAKPFLSNPTNCEDKFEAGMVANSWEEPFGENLAEWPKASAEVASYVECERIPFEPSLAVNPSTRSAESATGLDVSILVPQEWDNPLNNPVTITSSYLKGAKVTLPEGVTANPSLAAGLGSCTPAEYERETSSSLPGEGCPPESKIGSITIETPLLSETLRGAVYIATPYDNVAEFGDQEHPGGSLLALYVVAKDPARGVLIKVAGKIEPNPITGQLVTTFERQPGTDGGPAQEGLPQQPFSKFTLEFRPGATAPLISPPTCGSYSTQAQLTPWSAPSDPRDVSSQPFQITQGVREGACPSGGVPPFNPSVISGTQNNDGGSYSPFYLRIERQDGEQEITKFSTTLPPGLTGNLTGIPFCSDAAIQAAREKSGAQEAAEPSCPATSEIGHTIVEAGVGSVLAQTPGKIYLAGPYNGAPLSIVSITSAKVGPFDLGTVVIRFALDINPITAQVEVSGAQSDPIPHIIKGIVVHVRDIRVYMDRHNFTLNPTNCTSQNITDAITGAGTNPGNPAGQTTVNVLTPFTAADCSSLVFKPTFKVTTSGKTSRTDGASLHVQLTYPNAPQGTQSNIKSVKVDLPRQLPSRLSTLQKACVSSVFNTNPALCPAASRVGYAKAVTPVLPVPLEGPAYFVSYGDIKFPELIVVLQGYGFTIDLHGETFISKKGLTSSTFHTVPDQPVTSFELTLPEGPDSALAANGNFCAVTRTVTQRKKVSVVVHGHRKTVTRTVHKQVPATLQMPSAFTAQNGRVINQTTPIAVTGCAKHQTNKKPAKPKKKK